mgnify:CR=1 FL=1
MVEVIAAVGGALMTACFVSVGSVSYRGRQSRDDLVRNTTAIELLSTKIDDMHDDMKEVFHLLLMLWRKEKKIFQSFGKK